MFTIKIEIRKIKIKLNFQMLASLMNFDRDRVHRVCVIITNLK